VEFECGICGGTVDAPDELTGSLANCPHCGEEIVVPEMVASAGEVGGPESAPAEEWTEAEAAELVYEDGEAEMEEAPATLPPAPTPHHRAKRPEEKLGWALWVLILLGLATAGVGGYYVYVKVPAAKEWVDKTLGIEHGTGKPAKKANSSGARGEIPSGYYLSKKLSGVSGTGSEAASWEAPGEEGSVWAVVAASVPAALFVMPEDRYERMKEEYVRRFGPDSAKLFPAIDECRFFNPAEIVLVMPDGEELVGQLINLEFGVFSGFYQAFESHPQPGTPDSDWIASDEQMPVEIAFLLEDEDRFDAAGLRIRFGKRDAVAVPATRIK
jgi:hypothetical protein